MWVLMIATSEGLGVLKGEHDAGKVQSITPGLEGLPGKWLSFASITAVLCSRESTGNIQPIKHFLKTSNSEAVEGLVARWDDN